MIKDILILKFIFQFYFFNSPKAQGVHHSVTADSNSSLSTNDSIKVNNEVVKKIESSITSRSLNEGEFKNVKTADEVPDPKPKKKVKKVKVNKAKPQPPVEKLSNSNKTVIVVPSTVVPNTKIKVSNKHSNSSNVASM